MIVIPLAIVCLLFVCCLAIFFARRRNKCVIVAANKRKKKNAQRLTHACASILHSGATETNVQVENKEVPAAKHSDDGDNDSVMRSFFSLVFSLISRSLAAVGRLFCRVL